MFNHIPQKRYCTKAILYNEPDTSYTHAANGVKEETPLPEPWLTGTHSEVPAVGRAVLHALELAREDLRKWCAHFSDEQLNERPQGLNSIAFHIRHMARSMDRLLTYAEGHALYSAQLESLQTECDAGATQKDLFAELDAALESAGRRIRLLCVKNLESPRTVGTQQLPTSVGGLLVHVADHTQRHAGQAITTAKIIAANEERA